MRLNPTIKKHQSIKTFAEVLGVLGVVTLLAGFALLLLTEWFFVGIVVLLGGILVAIVAQSVYSRNVMTFKQDFLKEYVTS